MNLKGEKFIFNNEILNKQEFLKQYIYTSNNVYEVIRVMESKVLFWEEHLSRLNNSIIKFNREVDVNLQDLFEKIKIVIKENNIKYGNIKIDIIFIENNQYKLFIYPIEFYYPTEKDFIRVNTLNIERENPNVKNYNYEFKNKVENIIKENNIYEVILIDKQGYVTEGSRTNVYFVKGNCFYTAPIHMVLSGVTRLNVNKLIHKLGYNLYEESICKSDIYKFDGCFLTSTSSNILPVNEIDGIEINTLGNIYIKKLMDNFQKYLKYKVI